MSNSIPEMDPLIIEKVFRKRENWKKVLYLLENTNLTLKIIQKAAVVARANPFHNFGHQLAGAMEGVKIAYAEGLSREDATEIAFALLFHDALHRGIVQLYDEMRAVEAIECVISQEDIVSFSVKPYGQFMAETRDRILSTTFSRHGKVNGTMERIMQDADLAHLGQGPEYWMWSSMGLIAEFNRQREIQLTPFTFVRNEQAKFIAFLEGSGKGHVYLTEGAQKIFRDPAKDLKTVIGYGDAQIQFAYDVRHDDITVEEFKEKINSL